MIEANEGKPLKLLVYNTQSDQCREVVVTPNGAWGGEGRYGFTERFICLLIEINLFLLEPNTLKSAQHPLYMCTDITNIYVGSPCLVCVFILV